MPRTAFSPVLKDTQNAHRITCVDNGKYDTHFDDSIREVLQQISGVSISSDSINSARDYYTILSNTLLSQVEKSIINTHPTIASRWHPTNNLPLTPDKVTSGMRLNAWWICSGCNRPYQALVYSRMRNEDAQCKECATRKRAKERSVAAAQSNNFAEQYPELVKEIDLALNPGIIISELSAGSKTMINWKCSVCGNIWPATIAHRTTDTGCPVCGRERTTKAAKRAVINLDTKIEYESLTLAAKSVNGDKRIICACCRNRIKTAYSYRWAYKDPNDERKRHDDMLVHNIDTHEVFPTIQAAANAYGCSRSSIASALNGKSKTSQNCQWEWIPKQ